MKNECEDINEYMNSEDDMLDKINRANEDNYKDCKICGKTFYLLDDEDDCENLIDRGICGSCRRKILDSENISNMALSIGEEETTNYGINSFLLDYYGADKINEIITKLFNAEENKDSERIEKYFEDYSEWFIEEYKKGNK